MKTIILIFLFISISIISCNKDDKDKEVASTKTPVTEVKPKTPETPLFKPELFIGRWVRDDEFKMGFNLKSGGKVSSINMATLDYNSWKIEGNKLILNSTSKGVSNPVTLDEVYKIIDVSPEAMILAPADNPNAKWFYRKK